MIRDVFYVLITVALAVVSYFTSPTIYLPIGIVLLFNVYYFLIGRKYLIKKDRLVRRCHACYHFINAFIISMSVKESLEDAYQSGIRFEDKELNEITPEIENLNVSDRIAYLREFFNLAVFKMFINVLGLYQDQGGNILSMSDELISESTRIEKSISDSLAESNRYLGQFILLWVMAVSVLIFIRFSISSFYITMSKSSIFLFFLSMFFLVVLFSIHLFIVRYSSIIVKEDQV